MTWPMQDLMTLRPSMAGAPPVQSKRDTGAATSLGLPLPSVDLLEAFAEYSRRTEKRTLCGKFSEKASIASFGPCCTALSRAT